MCENRPSCRGLMRDSPATEKTRSSGECRTVPHALHDGLRRPSFIMQWFTVLYSMQSKERSPFFFISEHKATNHQNILRHRSSPCLHNFHADDSCRCTDSCFIPHRTSFLYVCVCVVRFCAFLLMQVFNIPLQSELILCRTEKSLEDL